MAIEVTDLDLAYAAGIFDGEGFVGLTINRQPTHRRVNMTYNLTVSIANTNLPLIAWLKDSFGGYISTRQYRKDEYPDRLLGYEWKIVARQADVFLRLLLPYLRIKREQTETALRFYGEAELHDRKGPSGTTLVRRLAPQEVERRRTIYQELRLLKKEGS